MAEEEIVEEPVAEEPPKEETLAEGEEKTTPPEKPAEPMVPLHRFREVNEKLEKVESEIADLKQAKASPQGLSEEQQQQLKAREDSKVFLKDLLKEISEDDNKKVIAQEQTEQRQFEKSVDEVLEVNPSVQKKDFVDFMEKNAEKYGIESVPGAMKLYLDLGNLSKEAKEQGKKDIQRKPGLPRSEGAGGGDQAPAEDKNKSFSQVVQDVIRSVKK